MIFIKSWFHSWKYLPHQALTNAVLLNVSVKGMVTVTLTRIPTVLPCKGNPAQCCCTCSVSASTLFPLTHHAVLIRAISFIPSQVMQITLQTVTGQLFITKISKLQQQCLQVKLKSLLKSCIMLCYSTTRLLWPCILCTSFVGFEAKWSINWSAEIFTVYYYLIWLPARWKDFNLQSVLMWKEIKTRYMRMPPWTLEWHLFVMQKTPKCFENNLLGNFSWFS